MITRSEHGRKCSCVIGERTIRVTAPLIVLGDRAETSNPKEVIALDEKDDTDQSWSATSHGDVRRPLSW